jgi:hypothetical protein
MSCSDSELSVVEVRACNTRRDMPDQTTAPPAPAEVAHSGADVLATLLTGPTLVELGVNDYSLAGPDFAKPPLTPSVTLLQAQSYSLGPLALSMPGWGIGIGVSHVSVDLGGRPPDIPDGAVKERLISALMVRLTQMRIERPSRPLHRKSKVVMDCVRELARAEKEVKATTSNRTFRDQVIGPAFDRWESSEQ